MIWFLQKISSACYESKTTSEIQIVLHCHICHDFLSAVKWLQLCGSSHRHHSETLWEALPFPMPELVRSFKIESSSIILLSSSSSKPSEFRLLVPNWKKPLCWDDLCPPCSTTKNCQKLWQSYSSVHYIMNFLVIWAVVTVTAAVAGEMPAVSTYQQPGAPGLKKPPFCSTINDIFQEMPKYCGTIEELSTDVDPKCVPLTPTVVLSHLFMYSDNSNTTIVHGLEFKNSRCALE